jgi:tripartite-type tricarboxylate transporter receptor subunit TctC
MAGVLLIEQGMEMKATRVIAVALLVALLPAGLALAQDYPARPVRIVAPAPAGGASDVYARIVAQHMSALFGRPFIVDNRVGAQGRIGYEYVAKAAPDGYTLVLATSAILIHRALYPTLPYDPLKDFTAIAPMARTQQLMVVPASLPVTDLKSFIALVKASPQTHNFASSGIGNPPHLAAELLCAMAGLEMTHIPYAGDTPAIVDTLAGRVSMYLGSVAPSVPHVRSGRLRALAVSGPSRSPALPEVPTMAEAGVPGYNVSGWVGMMAVGGTPRPVIEKLYGAMAKIMAMPEVQKSILDSGLEINTSSTEEFDRAIQNGSAVYREALRIAKVQPQP